MDLFRSADFAAYVKKLIERHHVPGLSIAIVQDGKVASAAYGKASLEPPRDCSPDTLFYVGSLVKSLTAASAGLLVEDDKYPEVQFEAPMAKLLPGDFVMPGEEHDHVTLEDVLCHRTGMAPHEYSILGPRAKKPDTPQSVTRNLRNLSVMAPNRAEHNYCNMLYTVVTYLIEQVSGTSFYDFLRKNILDPLDMKSTFALRDQVQQAGLDNKLATGYTWEKAKGKNRKVVVDDSPEAQGAGQMYSTVLDYANWIKAMLEHGGPLTEKLATTLTTKRIQQDPEDDPEQETCAFYALGWQVQQYSGYKIVSHDGNEPGFKCSNFFLPELNFGGVIFANSDVADTVVSLLMYRMIDDVAQHGSNGRAIREEGLGSESESESESVPDDDEDDDGLEDELREELSPGLEKPEPQKLPLSTYTATYSHPGYHDFTVQVKDDALFIDATDRSYGFTLTFKHICEQTKYICYMVLSVDPQDTPIKAEFRLEGDKAVKMGLNLQEWNDEYVWFERIE